MKEYIPSNIKHYLVEIADRLWNGHATSSHAQTVNEVVLIVQEKYLPILEQAVKHGNAET